MNMGWIASIFLLIVCILGFIRWRKYKTHENIDKNKDIILTCFICAFSVIAIIFTRLNLIQLQQSNETSLAENEENGTATFSSGDIMSFTFEGQLYTIPFSYEQLQDAGWIVSAEMDEVYEEGDDRVLLFLDNPEYDEIMMTVSSKTMSVNIKDTQSLISELKESGVWGLSVDLDSVDMLSDASGYPSFEVKGIGFGSSFDDVVEAFGDGYMTLFSSADEGMYVYDVSEQDGDYTVDYHLEIYLENDQVTGIDILVYYF